jgi:molybdenum cofactor cytidylyltransferase
MHDCVVGIILAAGLSSRMGRPKLVLEIDGIPIVARVTRAALESHLKRVILVSGPHPNDIERVLDDLCFHSKLAHVTNLRPELGMSESVGIGISNIDFEASGAMIILADQPLLTSEIIDQLLNVWSKDSTRIVVPTIRGRKTTPVIFPKPLFPELQQVTGDIGGREIIDRHPQHVVFVEIGTMYDDSDVDSDSDYERLTNSLSNCRQVSSHRLVDSRATTAEGSILKQNQQ